MEFTREIYWNVGHGLTTLGPMYILLVAALVVFVYGCRKRLKVYRQGLPLKRWDQPGRRIKNLLANVFLQRQVKRVAGAGTAHALFFWSFLTLFIGTTLIVVQADFTQPLFDIRFLTGTFYKFFSLALDLAGLIAIVMLLCLFVRRYLIRPKGLVSKSDDLIMHGLLLVILITGFFIEGARMAATELGTPLAVWSPVGLGFAQIFKDMSAESVSTTHIALWWFHLLLAFSFIAIIPYIKLRHLVTTSANSFFADLGPTGKLDTINLEDENLEHFGVATVQDLRWKDIFDADACTLCKRCQDRCPAYATGKALSPMQVINQIGDLAFAGSSEASLIETIGKEAIWACTTCRACQDICPASIEHVNKIVDMRRNLVLMEGEFPGEEVMAAMEQTEVNGNPLGMGYASRGEWAESLGVSLLADNADVDVLYFVGCYASFDRRNIAVAKSFIALCQAAGVRVGILGKEEKCCGEPMRKMGNEYLYQTLAVEMIATIEEYGVKKIVTTCPHCFNTLNKDYRDLGLNACVQPHTVFLNDLLQAGKLPIRPEAFSCTYHDSCYLGRHNNIYEPPRNLIIQAGGQIAEMSRQKSQAFCCSAGGGRIIAEETIGERINVKRVQMALETGADLLLSNCPFCLTMFEDGVKGADAEERLRPKDIAEILAERL